MTQALHFRRLESMYQAAPINEFYRPEMQVGEGEASITITVDEKHHHSGGGVHGSVYFKMLDDAAFFAANSLEDKVFVLTTSFTTYLTRPVAHGKLTAKGKMVNSNKSQFIAEAVVYDEKDNEIGRGNGIFVRGKLPLTDARGYLSYDGDNGNHSG
ncbi:PaaI family thioesterase [Thalassomonas actiniarum]|uniref:PaaI family thioesterase n=1 Tax=Thalassomonas actiniarum TaxID=485447 RepID=A0AAF0C5X5_9GAMM|nr:PaaI family thioesterase [Thalassomonas actiniarum]WDE01365.1 PaaI family thioesterase [Thalassomonas actiniarum]